MRQRAVINQKSITDSPLRLILLMLQTSRKTHTGTHNYKLTHTHTFFLFNCVKNTHNPLQITIYAIKISNIFYTVELYECKFVLELRQSSCQICHVSVLLPKEISLLEISFLYKCLFWSQGISITFKKDEESSMHLLSFILNF